jgi:PTH1 family peptidyl-tRNA hydrolase
MVVGLGNPGPAYTNTRHNVGFSVVQSLVRESGVRLQPAFGGLVGQARIGGQALVVCLPMTFMNRSGGPVSELARALGLSSARVLVVHDDLDLPFGTLRCKTGGGAGGHNGLRDIALQLGKDFPRIRIGIGRPPEGTSVPDHVLGHWSEQELGQVTEHISRAASAVRVTVSAGLDVAMNQFNVRMSPTSGQPQTKQQRALQEVRE